MTFPAILEIFTVGVATGFLLGILAPDLIHLIIDPWTYDPDHPSERSIP